MIYYGLKYGYNDLSGSERNIYGSATLVSTFFNVVSFLCVFSRIFRGNELYKAQAVTFLDSPDGKTATGTPFKSKGRSMAAQYFLRIPIDLYYILCISKKCSRLRPCYILNQQSHDFIRTICWNMIRSFFFWRARVCWQLLCLCRPFFVIFERYLDSNQRVAAASRRATSSRIHRFLSES
jgi:hypothetical protein